MDIEASKEIAGAWIAEQIVDDGCIEQAIFIGPRSKERAFEYAHVDAYVAVAIEEMRLKTIEKCVMIAWDYAEASTEDDSANDVANSIKRAIAALKAKP